MVRANKRNEALRIESALLNKIAMLGTEKTAEAVGVDKSQISRWKHDGREHVQSLTAQLRLGPADILESDENGIIPEQDRVITQVVILDADKKQIQCVVRPLQILRADGTWENIGGMK